MRQRRAPCAPAVCRWCRARARRSSGRRTACRGRPSGWSRRDASMSGQAAVHWRWPEEQCRVPRHLCVCGVRSWVIEVGECPLTRHRPQ
eukprot:5018479-Prymnesium_polylepis.1